jgi:hypothetical protein
VTAFKIDENLPVEAAALLAREGLDATTVLDERLGGHPDSEIALVCRSDAARSLPSTSTSRISTRIRLPTTPASWSFDWRIRTRSTY